ncbi:MAG: cysteine desulfurase family protein [Pseudomonadota bacterium]|nr:cysteine desulfurase family protein [Pseudomonadota bacterium]
MKTKSDVHKREDIYLDHSATTPVDPEVLGAMMRYFANNFGNPGSIHQFGRLAREAVDRAREQTAALIGAAPDEIVFTGSGTEADNLAILGAAAAAKPGKDHLITSASEHHAVLNTCKYLESKGFSVSYLAVDATGTVDPDDVRRAMTDRTLLISIMHGNNEIGTVAPLGEIAGAARQRGIPLHTDAVQSVGKIPVAVDELGVDLLSLSGHKFHGPKGIGALYARRGVPLAPVMFGGRQENGLRSGTENVPGIVGLGKACALARRDLPWQMDRLLEMRNLLEKLIREKIDAVRCNGHPFRRLPHVLSVSFRGVSGDAVVRELDRRGIAASAGAACASGTPQISHVLAALRIPEDYASGTVRFSLGRGNTEEQLAVSVDILAEIIQRLRDK